MKKSILFILYLIVTSVSSAQVSIGMRDTRYVNVSYLLKDHWEAKVEQSINAGNADYQNTKIYLGYRHDLVSNTLHLSASPYYTIGWTPNYTQFGALLNTRWEPLKHLNLLATINPHYDNMPGYKTCWLAGIAVPINDEIAIIAKYSTLPEYRVSEKRVRCGLEFKVKNLYVTPEASVSLEDGTAGLKAVRMCVNMSYTFKK